MSTLALEAVGLCRNFGALTVARDLSLALPVGARHALIGPNGAGKTTLINMLTGALAPTSGRILLKGEDVTLLPPNRRVKRGLARTFQVTTLFPDMTPLEAVSLAVLEREGLTFAWLPPIKRYRAVIDESARLLDQLGLGHRAHEATRRLAYGEQRLVEVAVALAGRPAVLLLDEPMAGIPPEEASHVFSTIAGLPREVAILIIEHDMDLVFRFASRITVMVAGTILVEGDPATIMADERVQAIYLGDAEHGAAASA
jgi:ABC-type branched-subunit amino acid transport system ATPase component